MKSLLILCSCSFLLTGLLGQSTLSGKIQDKENGEKLGDTEILVFLVGGEVPIYQGRSQSNGSYRLHLRPGYYNIVFKRNDFEELRINDVIVMEGQITSLDIDLTPGHSLSQLLILTAYPPVMKMDFSRAVKNMDRNAIRRAPVKSIQELSAAAGVSFQ
ncbi:MAG: carboxypeptidase-like regulatory domain-containing protein [Bacteroidota bacterium]